MRSSIARAIVRIAHFTAAGILIVVATQMTPIVAALFAMGAAGFIVREWKGVK